MRQIHHLLDHNSNQQYHSICRACQKRELDMQVQACPGHTPASARLPKLGLEAYSRRRHIACVLLEDFLQWLWFGEGVTCVERFCFDSLRDVSEASPSSQFMLLLPIVGQ